MGLLYRLFHIMLCDPSCGEGSLLVATVIFVGLCNIETDFSLIMGGLITNLFAFYLVLRMMPTSSVKLPMNVFSFR